MLALQTIPIMRGPAARKTHEAIASANDSATRRRHFGAAIIAQLRAGRLAPEAVPGLLEDPCQVAWQAQQTLPSRPRLGAGCAPSEICNDTARQHICGWITALLRGRWIAPEDVQRGIAGGDDGLLQVLREGWLQYMQQISAEVVALAPPVTNVEPIYSASPSAWYAEEGQETLALVLEVEGCPVVPMQLDGAPPGMWRALDRILARASKKMTYLHIATPDETLYNLDGMTHEAFEDVWLAMRKEPVGTPLSEEAVDAYCGLVGTEADDVPAAALEAYVAWRRVRTQEEAAFPAELATWFQEHSENVFARKLQALDAFTSRLPPSKRVAELDFGGDANWDTFFPMAGLVDCDSGLWDNVADCIDSQYNNASRTWVAAIPRNGASVAATSRRVLVEATFLAYFLGAVRDLSTPA